MAGSALSEPSPGYADVRPIATVRANRCADDRYPALAGAWVIGCVSDDKVNVAVSLEDGRVVTLSDAVTSPGLADGWAWAPGRPPGGWVLPGASRGGLQGEDPLMVPFEGVSPPALARVATAGCAGCSPWRAAVAYADHIDLIDLAVHTWPRFAAHPLPGESVALGDGWAAWTERSADTGADVWIVQVAAGGATQAGVPTVLAGGKGDQHGVVGGGHYAWWVDGDSVVCRDVRTGTVATFPAYTGFEAGLAVTADGQYACWEDRRRLGTAAGIDIRCSDGTVIDRPGDQRWPSLGAGWLIFREGEQVLATRFPMGG